MRRQQRYPSHSLPIAERDGDTLALAGWRLYAAHAELRRALDDLRREVKCAAADLGVTEIGTRAGISASRAWQMAHRE